MKLRIGVHIGPQNIELEELRRLWRWADRHLDWVSVWDHFYEAPYLNGESPHFEAATLMAAIASDTTRVRIGCLVLCMLYRNPALLAKEMVTIDHLSGGRLEVGLGAGWHEAEFKAYGYEFPPIGRRLDMLEEGTRVLRSLFTEPRTDFDGRYYQVIDAACYPKPVQARLPIWIGGRGEKRTLRLAARYADGWNAAYIGPEEFAHKCRVLDGWCEQENRDPTTIERSINLNFYMAASAAGAAAGREKLRQQWGEQAAERGEGSVIGGPAEAIDYLGRFAEAGASRLNIALRPPLDWEALEAFVQEVVPRFA